MKPFGKQRPAEQALQPEARQQISDAVELANLFTQFVKADSLAEALAELKELVAETEAEESPAAAAGAPQAAQETPSMQPSRMAGQSASTAFTGQAGGLAQQARRTGGMPQSGAAKAERTADLLAQAYRELEGTLDEEQLDKLMEDEAFAQLLAAGVPAKLAARCLLMDEFMLAAEARGEKRGRAQAKNKLGRMSEVGTAMSNAFRTGIDPDKLSLQDIRELKRRAGRGETITL